MHCSSSMKVKYTCASRCIARICSDLRQQLGCSEVVLRRKQFIIGICHLGVCTRRWANRLTYALQLCPEAAICARYFGGGLVMMSAYV